MRLRKPIVKAFISRQKNADTNSMDRESFLYTVKKNYSEEIMAAYLECEHEAKVDFDVLNKRLIKLMGNAKVEGLSAKEFEDLVKSTLPDVSGRVDLKSGG